MTFEEALEILVREGYEPCERPDHGFGSTIVVDGVSGPCTFMICPVVQFYPKPTFLFHSKEQFICSTEEMAKRRGWL